MKPSKIALLTVTAALTFFSQRAHADDAVTVNVPASANPYLAGAPDGAVGACDTAPGTPPYVVSPPSVPGLLTNPNAQETLYFYATGSAEHSGGTPSAKPDGTSFWTEPADRGISACIYPLDALVGVFLDDSTPMPGDTAPPGLDFSDGSSGGGAGLTPVPGGKDYSEIAPQLRQLFFIGDGFTSAGVGQKVKAPLGATRLFLASTDGCGWYNNNGGYSVLVAKKPITIAPPHGGLSETVFRINGSANPTGNLTDTALHFTAKQGGTPEGLVVRVQMNTVPNNNLNDWVDLPNGAGHGYMTIDKTTGQFVLTSTNYPNASSVYFRALATAPGYPDSKSNIIGPLNLSYGKGHMSHTTLYGATNGNGQEINFRADIGVDQAATTLYIQTTKTPDDDTSWIGLSDGRAGQMYGYANRTTFYLDTTKYPSGDVVYFRAVAEAPGFVPSFSNIVGIRDVVNGAQPTLDIVPPFPQPGSESGLDIDHPIIVAMGTFNIGLTNVTSPDGKAIKKLGEQLLELREMLKTNQNR